MNAYKTRHITYRYLASQVPSGRFHTTTGIPADRDSASFAFTALTGEALKLHLISQDEISRGLVPVLIRTYEGTNHTEGIIIIGFRYADSNYPANTHHPLSRLIRHMTCRVVSATTREDIRYRTHNSRGRAADREIVAEQPRTARQRYMDMPLTPDTFNYDRALGVELELVSKSNKQTLTDALPIWCRRADDGSLRATSSAYPYVHEVRALFVRSQMEPRLFRLCNTLQALECSVNKSCGLHIHLDQRGETTASAKKRATIMDRWLCALQELVPMSRRTNDYCKFGISERDRYHAVNFVAFQKYKTIEVRLHSGTIDYTKILAWIRLCELLAAMRHKPKEGGCIATLEQLPLAGHDLAYWRARHRDLNPHLYSNQNTTTEQE